MKRILIILFCMILALMNIEYRPVFAATVTGHNYLNNGYIQFTNNYNVSNFRELPITSVGTAINDYGNLNNPYYFNGTVWRPLTLSRQMEYALSEGGTLVSESDPYNVSEAGAIVYPATTYPTNVSQTLNNFTVDGSGIVMKEQTTTSGNVTYTGTMISKGELLVNGKNLEIKNTYTLLEGKSFVKVKTRITNLSTSEATNVRYWVGTGDDWISTDDTNHKSRGNIIDGVFVTSANATIQSKAIRVDSQLRNDSILFYSTHINANTSVSSCCDFSNAVLTNPFSSAVNVTNDGAYALFVNLETIAVGAYQEFDWYYAAGSASTILDTINDVALDSSGASDITGNSATITYTSDTTTTGYYIVLARGSTAPTADQIINNEYTSAPVIKRGSSIMNAGEATDFGITDLAPGSDYDVYFVTRNSESVTSSVALTQFSTRANSIISLLSISSIDVPRNNRVPESTDIETIEYTATVSWSPEVSNFNDGVEYTATITITPKVGYTLTGVNANAFSVTGATTTNLINEGIVKAVYPAVPLDHVYFYENGGTSVSDMTYDFDAFVSEPFEISRTGYEFAGWFQDDTSFSNPWDFEAEKMPSSDLNLYAKWTALEQTTTYKANGGIGSDFEQTAKTDSTTILSSNSFTRVGYSFSGWSLNSSDTTPTYTNNQSITWFNTDTNLYAIYTANNQTVTFNANGGVGANTTQVAKTDSSNTLNANTFTKDGYTFKGWSKNVSAINEDYSDAQSITWFNENTYLYAVWEAEDHTITFNANGGVGVDTNQNAKSDSDTKLNINPFTKVGYTFIGWSLNRDATEETYINQQEIAWVKNDTTLYAVWDINRYSVEFNENGGTSVSDQTIIYNTKVTRPSNPNRLGYAFAGWIADNASVFYNFEDSVSQNLILRARWNANVYQITYDLAGGTSNLPTSYTVMDTINLTMPIRSGYMFKGWFMGDQVVKIIPSGTTGNLNLVAKWTFVPKDPVIGTLLVSNVLVDSIQVDAEVKDFGNPKAVAFGYELKNLDENTILEIPTNSNLSFLISNLEPYTNYSVRVYANSGTKVVYSNEASFKTQLSDSDKDGVPDARDSSPDDSSKKTSYANVSYTSPSLLTLTGTISEADKNYHLQINPVDLITLKGNDTIKIKMGNVEYTIPVALFDDLLAKQTNLGSYLELVVESDLMDTVGLNILDSVNMKLLNAYDYSLFMVYENGTKEEMHTFNGQIQISINLDDIESEYDPANLEVYYYDSDTEELSAKNAEYDAESNSLIFFTDHFSYYVLGTIQESSNSFIWYGLGVLLIVGLLILLFKKRKSNT